MREIRTLRAMWRALETELRQFLNGHEEGNLGYKAKEKPGRRASARPYQDRLTPEQQSELKHSTELEHILRMAKARAGQILASKQ